MSMSATVERMPRRRAKGPPDLHSEIQAQLANAEATMALADALREFTQELKPAVKGIAGLFDAQQKFCDFLTKHRLKIATSIPTVAVAVFGLSPNAAAAIHAGLQALGWLH